MNPLSQQIKSVCDSIPAGKKRVKALMAVKWVLATDSGELVGQHPKQLWKTVLTRNLSEATHYSAMDNHELKARFFQSILKQSLTVVLLEESCAS